MKDMANTPPDLAVLSAATEAAGRMIPPVWPLASAVAVNPYLGHTGQRLAETGAVLGRAAGLQVTQEIAQMREGLSDDALEAAWAASPYDGKPATFAELKAALDAAQGSTDGGQAVAPKLPLVSELARDASGTDWPALLDERIGAFFATQVDQGQALWRQDPAQDAGGSLWDAWRVWAAHDLTLEIHGLAGSCAKAQRLPADPAAAIALAAMELGLPDAAAEGYFHALLLDLGGWAHVARYRVWQAELGGGIDHAMQEALAIRLTLEAWLHAAHDAALAAPLAESFTGFAAPASVPPALILAEIVQEARERQEQARLAGLFSSEPRDDSRPVLQAAFCIDVRSEVFRRALEAQDAGVETIGFAGFFGVAVAHQADGSDIVEARLPVLLSPPLTSKSTPADDTDLRLAARARRAWHRFKAAAVSSFAFVEAAGPFYAAKLVKDATGVAAKSPYGGGAVPEITTALDEAAMIDAAETVLRAMSMTRNHAPLVLLAGHGGNVTNNAHAAAYHCGACGGYSGEVNARLVAGLLNHPAVRAALPGRGIELPDDTLFVAALHDTTTDEVALYTGDVDTSAHGAALAQARKWLKAAGALARAERAPRLPGAARGGDLARRAVDWAEMRPEWALAGNRAFIAAPRHRTASAELKGQAFLHSYDWRADEGFPVLELILTAPVVVASWISLQYYGSTVSPEAFGGGDKVLHNVVGGIGVVEGNGGKLRVGLPWQSVHDGETLAHAPLRLTVCIEAPTEAISAILDKHPEVAALFDQGWLHLFALDDEGRMRWRYKAGNAWEDSEAATAAQAAA
jgi:uncharacterized protein YbcC (UPF0753/DUF2309 family)